MRSLAHRRDEGPLGDAAPSTRYHGEMSSSTPEPPTSPLYLRLPALALSLGIAGFLVFQAGVPGCGPNAENPTTNSPASPAVSSPEVGPAAGSAEKIPASAAEGSPEKPSPEIAPPAANAAPEPPNLGNADDPADSNLADDADTPNAKEKNAGNAGNADAKPRFFPASKAMVPLLEPELIAPSDDPPQAQKAPPAQQAQQAPSKGL